MSNLKAFMATLSAPAATPPTPTPGVVSRLLYQADSLAPGAVTGWRNEGTTGTAQSLVAGSGQAAPTCLAGGPNGHQFVRFVGQDYLTTPGLLGLSGPDPVAVALVYRLADVSKPRNMFGWGVQDNGKMFDVYNNQGQPVLHNYGAGGPLTDAAATSGAWQVFYVENYNALLSRLNGIEGTPSPAQQPAPGTLHVGAGQWPPLNAATQLDIAHFEVAGQLTASEKEALLTRLATTYALTT